MLESVHPLDPPTLNQILDGQLEQQLMDDLNPADFQRRLGR